MGESWLAVGDLTFHLTGDAARLTPADRPLARPFLVEPRHADIEIRARWAATPPAVSGRQLFAGGDAWQLHADGDARLFTFHAQPHDRTPYKWARFDAGFSAGVVEVSRSWFAEYGGDPETVDPMDYPLDEVLTIHALAQGRGVAIHACGLLDADGRAYVLAGQSGAGKSTLARWCAAVPGFTLLSDERLIIRTDRPTPTVFGTPWHGDALFVSPRSGPLAGILFLQQASAHAIVPLPASLAVARLLSCAFVPFHDAAAVSQSIAAIERAASAAACAELQFAKSADVVDLLPGVRRRATR